MRPCSISNGIVRNADAPNSPPIAEFAFEFGVAYLDRSPRSVAIRPYFSIYDPNDERYSQCEFSTFCVCVSLPIRWPFPVERFLLATNAMFQFFPDAVQTLQRMHCECYSPNSPIRPFVDAIKTYDFFLSYIFQLHSIHSHWSGICMCVDLLDMVLGRDMRHRTLCSNRKYSRVSDARVSVA